MSRKNECSRCGVRPHVLSHRYCQECKNELAREWRKTHPLKGEPRKKSNARSYANLYQRRGKIKKQPCEVCGSTDAQKHHDDYSRPTDVRWLCKKHHIDHHKKDTEAKNAMVPRGSCHPKLPSISGLDRESFLAGLFASGGYLYQEDGHPGVRIKLNCIATVKWIRRIIGAGNIWGPYAMRERGQYWVYRLGGPSFRDRFEMLSRALGMIPDDTKQGEAFKIWSSKINLDGRRK